MFIFYLCHVYTKWKIFCFQLILISFLYSNQNGKFMIVKMENDSKKKNPIFECKKFNYIKNLSKLSISK